MQSRDGKQSRIAGSGLGNDENEGSDENHLFIPTASLALSSMDPEFSLELPETL